MRNSAVWRKVMAGLVMATVMLALLEGAARAYVSFCRRTHNAWSYGFSSWDGVRTGAAAQAERETAARVADQAAPDRQFAERAHLPGAERVAPETMNRTGIVGERMM